MKKSKKCPYQFPLRSREAMLGYLRVHESYHPLNVWNGGFVLSWDVKVYNPDWSGHSGSYTVDASLDAAWAAHVQEQAAELDELVFEAARFLLSNGEYSTYPGDDQGQYTFFFNGRSGGHLCLASCDIVPAMYTYGVIPFSFHDRGHYSEYLASLSYADLRTLYKAIVCMDSDFTRANATVAVNEQINFFRSQWEEEQREIDVAAEMAAY